MWLLPQTNGERATFLLLCLLIGLVEEFLFRGFAFFTISGLTGPLIAGSIVTISFALQHGIQDTIGIVRAFVLGVLLLIPVLVTGSLLPSIVMHAVVDVFSGLYGRAAVASFEAT
jgi:membrane protease YdiL (CAAX protease family)